MGAAAVLPTPPAVPPIVARRVPAAVLAVDAPIPGVNAVVADGPALPVQIASQESNTSAPRVP